MKVIVTIEMLLKIYMASNTSPIFTNNSNWQITLLFDKNDYNLQNITSKKSKSKKFKKYIWLFVLHFTRNNHFQLDSNSFECNVCKARILNYAVAKEDETITPLNI